MKRSISLAAVFLLLPISVVAGGRGIVLDVGVVPQMAVLVIVVRVTNRGSHTVNVFIPPTLGSTERPPTGKVPPGATGEFPLPPLDTTDFSGPITKSILMGFSSAVPVPVEVEATVRVRLPWDAAKEEEPAPTPQPPEATPEATPGR